jgi:predicted dehydrogenase
MRKLKIGLFGSNGHQLNPKLPGIPEAEVTAVCGIPEDKLAGIPAAPARYERFEDLLNHPELDLVSICSPLRSGQYEHIRAALLAGKHVYAEKPLVMRPEHLDELIALAREKELFLRDMASTAYLSPYAEMKEVVASGRIGEVVQVTVRKSYPFGDWRPQDEDVDGGLLLQVGIHAIRMVEQVAGRRVLDVSAVQTRLGNPVRGGGLHRAAQVHMRLEGGAIGTADLNYLNQPGTGVWGYEQLCIFGTEGFVESQPGGQAWLVAGDRKEPIRTEASRPPHFQWFVREILGQPAPLLPMEAELHPLRVLLRARESAQGAGDFLSV